jgi:protein gp37
MAREQGWPKHIWMIATAENQKRFEERVPILTDAPIGIRGVLLEPLLGPIDLHPWLGTTYGKIKYLTRTLNIETAIFHKAEWEPISPMTPKLDWVIVGCETGPGRRECKIELVADIVRQCKAAGIPVFVKQVSINGKVSHNPAEWPEEVRVQEWVT